MRVVVCLVVVACGGTPVHEPVAPVAAAPTCSDVGVILRGAINGESTEAGPAREAAIAQACETDHWPGDVIQCVTANRKPASCLDKLATPQRVAYEDKLAAWSEKFGGDENGEEGGVEMGVVGGVIGSSNIPNECIRYGELIARLQSCDKMPAAARDALRQGFEAAAGTWLTLPQNDLKALAVGCKAGYDAVYQSGKAVCGW